MNNNEFISKNSEKRYGSFCKQCGKKLGEYRLDGVIKGESMSFCSFICHDLYLPLENNDGVKK